MLPKIQPNYHIFISHNHNDNEIGYRLADDLRRALAENNSGTVWYDSKGGRENSNEGLRAGDNWQKVIREQLIRSNIFIVLLSKKANRSVWVKDEIDIARPRCVRNRLRIITVQLDNCRIPDVLNLYQLVSCLSPNDYKVALDEILKGLGLSAVSYDPDDAFAQRHEPLIERAFAQGEWNLVIQHVSSLIRHVPKRISSLTYHMYALALLEQEEVEESQKVLNNTKTLQMDEQSYKLLCKYVQRLIEMELWDQVSYRVRQILKRFPNENYWLHLQQMASSKERMQFSSHTKTQSFSSVTSQSSLNGTINTVKLNEIDLGASERDPITEHGNISLERLSAITDTILNDSQAAPSSTSWQMADTVVGIYVPPHKVRKIFLTPSSMAAAISNVIGLLWLVSTWHLRDWQICTIGIVVLVVFILGRLFGGKARGIFLAFLISIFWIAIGYTCGYSIIYASKILNLSLDNSTGSFIMFILSFIAWFTGLCWHYTLFQE